MGNVKQLTNSGQTVTDTYDTDAWGANGSSSGSTVNPFRFGGQFAYFTDSDSGLLRLGVRYLDPANGRFTQRDLVSEPANAYPYAGSGPTAGVDPAGLTDDTGDYRYRKPCQDLQSGHLQPPEPPEWGRPFGLDVGWELGKWGQYCRYQCAAENCDKETGDFKPGHLLLYFACLEACNKGPGWFVQWLDLSLPPWGSLISEPFRTVPAPIVLPGGRLYVTIPLGKDLSLRVWPNATFHYGFTMAPEDEWRIEFRKKL